MPRGSLSNPLALAVLSLLHERPMHPYEMSSTLRTRQKESSIKLNYGSLYSVVESLLRNKLVEVHDVVREGRRPERTVYAITEAGERKFTGWLGQLLSTPVKEYPQFEAALSLVGGLGPDEVLDLLRVRVSRLEAEIIAQQAILDRMTELGFPRLFAIEGEYVVHQSKAEMAFVRGLVAELADGTFDHIDLWRRFHTESPPTEEDWRRAGVSFDTDLLPG